MVGVLRLALGTHARSGGRTVVSVGHVEGRDAAEDLRDAVIRRTVADHPQFVAEAVGSREVVLGGRSRHNALDNGVDLGIVRIGEEDRLDVGLLVAHVDHAVLLLLGARQLVFLDGAREVVLEVAAHRQTVLRAAVHRLGIDVVVLLGILHEPAPFAPQAEVLHRLVVDLGGMLVGDRIEVDLGFDDVQQRTLRRFGLGLGRVQHVVGARSHLRSILLRGPDSAERFDSYHNSLFRLLWMPQRAGAALRTRPPTAQIPVFGITCSPGNGYCPSSGSRSPGVRRPGRR